MAGEYADDFKQCSSEVVVNFVEYLQSIESGAESVSVDDVMRWCENRFDYEDFYLMYLVTPYHPDESARLMDGLGEIFNLHQYFQEQSDEFVRSLVEDIVENEFANDFDKAFGKGWGEKAAEGLEACIYEHAYSHGGPWQGAVRDMMQATYDATELFLIIHPDSQCRDLDEVGNWRGGNFLYNIPPLPRADFVKVAAIDPPSTKEWSEFGLVYYYQKKASEFAERLTETLHTAMSERWGAGNAMAADAAIPQLATAVLDAPRLYHCPRGHGVALVEAFLNHIQIAHGRDSAPVAVPVNDYTTSTHLDSPPSLVGVVGAAVIDVNTQSKPTEHVMER